MSSSIAQNIEALCQEQGIDRDLVIEAMKEAVRAAAKKQPFRSSRPKAGLCIAGSVSCSNGRFLQRLDGLLRYFGTEVRAPRVMGGFFVSAEVQRSLQGRDHRCVDDVFCFATAR